MTDPTLAQTYEWGRLYARTRGGHPNVPSITTILDAMSHDMEWWEALCAVQACMEHSRRLVDVQSMPEGPEKWSRVRKAKDWLMGAAERDRDAAARRGDFVHNYAEALALHAAGRATQQEVDHHRSLCEAQGLNGYMASLHQFWEDYQPTPVEVEATVWHDGVGYAGTTDLICHLDTPGGRVLAVLDWKTRRALFKRNGQRKDNELQAYTGMQLTAAAMATERWVQGATPQEDRWVPFEHEPDVGLGVALGPDGYSVRAYDIYDPLLWDTFRALRTVWEFKREGALRMSSPLQGVHQVTPRTPRVRAAPETTSTWA